MDFLAHGVEQGERFNKSTYSYCRSRSLGLMLWVRSLGTAMLALLDRFLRSRIAFTR